MQKLLVYVGKQVNPEKLVESSSSEDLLPGLYQTIWQPLARDRTLKQSPKALPSSWLIFADESRVGTNLARMLEAQGDNCILVFPGSTSWQLTAQSYQINPAELLYCLWLLQKLKTIK